MRALNKKILVAVAAARSHILDNNKKIKYKLIMHFFKWFFIHCTSFKRDINCIIFFCYWQKNGFSASTTMTMQLFSRIKNRDFFSCVIFLYWSRRRRLRLMIQKMCTFMHAKNCNFLKSPDSQTSLQKNIFKKILIRNALIPAMRTGFTISYIITKREQKTIACPYLVMNSHYDIA